MGFDLSLKVPRTHDAMVLALLEMILIFILIRRAWVFLQDSTFSLFIQNGSILLVFRLHISVKLFRPVLSDAEF